MSERLKAPFPYFGGKRKAAPMVWAALGDVRHYIEPFFGSGAVLLARQDYDPERHTETVCDKCGFVANVWRALKFSPDAVAEWADWPVNHIDLNARRKAMLAAESRLLERLGDDPEWHDPKIAGYWIWAASCWIGSGLTRPNAMPDVSTGGRGVNAGKIPIASRVSGGIHAGQIPHLADTGRGVQGKRPRVDWGTGINAGPDIRGWFGELSARLRRVRVVCGDWSRVCGGNWQADLGVCGMFFDPPYGAEAGRDKDIYAQESATVAGEVRDWCLSRGDNPRYRIVLSGYEGEHNALESRGWSKIAWKANGGYANRARGANRNREKERLWLSPHCVRQGRTEYEQEMLI